MTSDPHFGSNHVATATPCIQPKIFVFYLVPDSSVLALSLSVEALRLANQVLGYEAYNWRFISESGGTVRTSCGLSLATDDLHSERQRLFSGDQPSMVVICADDTMEYYANKSVEAWLRECSRRAIGVGSLGAGTYFLARAGLLANRHCTIHWENLPDFSERFSGSTVSCNLYQIDGNIWTCAGGMASFDMILGLIERDFGERTAAGVCERAVVGRVRGPNERQRLPLSERHGTSNEFLVKAIEQMERHLTEPLPIEEIASRIGRSRRQVERMFRRELNRSPVRYYRELRLERARLLLVQSAMPVVDIAIACGFISASHFSKVYREMNGIAPQDTRRARDVRLPSLLHS